MALILLGDAEALNGATIMTDGGLTIETHLGSGVYSAFIPLVPEHEDEGAVEFMVSVDLLSGSASIAALGADKRELVAERFFFSQGSHQARLCVPQIRGLSGLLIRNAATDGTPSRIKLLNVVARPTARMGYVPPPRRSLQLTLPVRRAVEPIGGTEDRPERGGGSVVTNKSLNTENTAVIVIDAWASHHFEGWGRRITVNIEESLWPALNAFRSVGARIIHSAGDRQVHELARPIPGEGVIEGAISHRDFAAELREAGVYTLIYMGYGSNRCVMTRPVGIMKMFAEQFDIILVRDASTALENAETFRGELRHRAMIDLIDALGGTVSTAEVIRAAANHAT
jgi:nicotinamidase-related amidase